jgi:hypothetical protein
VEICWRLKSEKTEDKKRKGAKQKTENRKRKGAKAQGRKGENKRR